MVMANSSGRVLSQAELRTIHTAQNTGTMTTVREQLNLRRTFLEKVRNNHPSNAPLNPFDLHNAVQQKVVLNKSILDSYRMEAYVRAFEKMAPKATAGLRDTYDAIDWNNPEYMYNPVFMALLIEAEADFLIEQHAEKSARLSGMDLNAKAREIESQMSPSMVAGIREIFGGRTIVQILELLRDKPMKVISKEVRPQNEQMLELDARIMAAKGITIITTENFTDTNCIYLNSFLCYLLGSDGGTFYTPSHSPVYVLGRKFLAGDGAQLLPDVYARFIYHFKTIYNKAMTEGYTITLSQFNDKNILKTINAERAAKLFAETLPVEASDIDAINKAAANGFKVIMNTFSGSGAKALKAQTRALGVNIEVFEPMLEEEDPYFRAGYRVAEKDGAYFVDHLGLDMTMKQIVQQTPYAEMLQDTEIGTMVYECDPDNDRFTVKQVLSEEAEALCRTFGIDTYKLGNGKILAAPSPNKTFLLLDIADYEMAKASGEWEKYHWLYFPTYVSSNAWIEFANWLKIHEGNISTALSRVGFKNFNYALKAIQDWWYGRPDEEYFTLTPQLGEDMTLNRKKPLRVLSKEEESGGRASGFKTALTNILGEKSLSLPEKAVGDALLAHLVFMARRFNEGQEMSLPKIIESKFDQYELVSKVDARIDVLHGDQGVIAQVGADEAAKLKANAGAEKWNFNDFFFSLAKAVRQQALSIDEMRKILKKVMPKWADTWDCLDVVFFVEEEITADNPRPEGVVMSFLSREGNKPLVTQFKFRPSGTDPLKSKVYLDAESLTPEILKEIIETFNALKRMNLFQVLNDNSIPFAEEQPDGVEDIGLANVG